MKAVIGTAPRSLVNRRVMILTDKRAERNMNEINNSHSDSFESMLSGASSGFAGTAKRAKIFRVLDKYLEHKGTGSIPDLRKVLMRNCFVTRDRADIWIEELMEMGIIDIKGNTWLYCAMVIENKPSPVNHESNIIN